MTYWKTESEHVQTNLNHKYGDDTFWVSCQSYFGVETYQVHNSEGDCVGEFETLNEVEHAEFFIDTTNNFMRG